MTLRDRDLVHAFAQQRDQELRRSLVLIHAADAAVSVCAVGSLCKTADHAWRRSKSSSASLYFITFFLILDESTHVIKSSMLRVT